MSLAAARKIWLRSLALAGVCVMLAGFALSSPMPPLSPYWHHKRNLGLQVALQRNAARGLPGLLAGEVEALQSRLASIEAAEQVARTEAAALSSFFSVRRVSGLLAKTPENTAQ